MEKFRKILDDGSVLVYDACRYMKLVGARNQLGMGKRDSELRNKELKDHPLLGEKIRKASNGKEYVVEKVNKQWFNGYYLGMLLNCDNSHVFVCFENINCEDDIVLEHIERTRKEFGLEANTMRSGAVL